MPLDYMGAIAVTDEAETIFTGDSDDDRTYFRGRAAWHEQRAEIASDSSTRMLHRRFAKMYATRSLSQTST